jgi:hypothetical protein
MIAIMRYHIILLFVGAVVFTACKTKAPAVGTTASNSSNTGGNTTGGNEAATGSPFISGVISTAHAGDGCDYLFICKIDGKKLMLRPIKLEKKYQENGLKVKVKFRASRVAQGSCTLGQPIIIDDIEKL